MPMTFGEWKKNKERMEAGQAAPNYASRNTSQSGNGMPQSAIPHAYAGHAAEWNALRADAEQLGMASAYGLPSDQYYRYRGGKPGWMMEADAEDYKRLLAENPPASQKLGSPVPGTGAGELRKLEARLKAMGNGTYPPFDIGEEVPKSTKPQPYAGYTDEWNDLRANAAQLGMVSADGTPTDRYYQRMGGKPYWMIEADYADYLRMMAENSPFQKKSSYDVTSDPLYIAYMQSGNDFQYGDGLPSLQSVDFAPDWMPPLASGNGSGIIKESMQQFGPGAANALPGRGNTPLRALASAGAAMDVGYANGVSPYSEPGVGEVQQRNSDSANGTSDEEIHLKDTDIDFRGFMPKKPPIIEPIPEYEILFSDKGNYLLNKGVYPDVNEYTLMPLIYLKQVQARMIQEGFTYAGGALDRTGRKTECVGMTRLPAILWYSSSMYFRLQDENIIETKVSDLYNHATYKGVWNDNYMRKFDGMQLVYEDKSHIATYYTDFTVEYNGDPGLDLSEYKQTDIKYVYDEKGTIEKTIVTYYDVVVDITGKRYGGNMTNEEVDNYNNPSDEDIKKKGKERKEIRIKDYNAVKNKFAYWCALDYVDYGDQQDPDSNQLTPNKDIPLKKRKRK